MLVLATPALASEQVAPDPLKTLDGHPFDLRHERPTTMLGPRALLGSQGPVRVVVGVHDPADLRSIQRLLERTGAHARVIRELSVVAAATDDVPQLVRALEGDARVAYSQVERTLRPLADPFDAVDPLTGLAFTWAYDAINAGTALAAIGGGSQFPVAIIDTGVDVNHPDLAGRVLGSYSAVATSTDVTDELGHGTFVAGLVSAIDGNGIGGKGAAGATGLLAVKASTPGGEFFETELASGIVWAVDSGARVINLSLGGSCPSSGVMTAAMDYAYEHNVVLVAAAGNNALTGNTPNCPAAELGGTQGSWSTGLSVAATRPDGQRAVFSTFNQHVNVAAPGASAGDCRFGVLSAIPNGASLWDAPTSCSDVFAPPEGAPARWAYGEGTSFAAPLVSAVASLALQANPNLSAEQVAEVVKRSARQPLEPGWNQQIGFGNVDAAAAVDLARRFDTAPPDVVLTVTPRPQSLTVTLGGNDVARPGEEPIGGLLYKLERSRDGVDYEELVPEQTAPWNGSDAASRAGPPYWYRAWVCDLNRNCSLESVGPSRPVLVKPRVRLKAIKRGGRSTVLVRLKKVKGLKGRPQILLQRRDRGRFRTVERFKLGFGKATKLRVKRGSSSGQRIRYRALVRKAPDWRAAKSRSISVRVPERSAAGQGG